MSPRGFRAVVYLDRDGTVIEERHYLSAPEQVSLLPRAAEAIARLNDALIAAVLVTNQSGVARGYFSETQVHLVHDRLRHLLEGGGARLDAVFYCPHLETAVVEGYRKACRCRKPMPGMVEAARAALDLHGLPEFVIGDKTLDLQLAEGVGARGLLVRTGYGRHSEPHLQETLGRSAEVVDDLFAAVQVIESALSGGRP